MSENICSIIVHGGAWSIPESRVTQSAIGVKTAVMAGYSVLASGGSALDAVETAVTSMEDNYIFNAGIGSSLTQDGHVELDAAIMDGSNLNSGAVAAVRNVKNPVKLARLVMEKSDHTLIVGDGASRLAEKLGVHIVSEDELIVNHAREELQNYNRFHLARDILYRGLSEASSDLKLSDHETVGACALDVNGHVAFAVSTGGLAAKLPGRVGDTPLIGSGGYADDEYGAVACTGHGESISKTVLGFRIYNKMTQGMSVQLATESGLSTMKQRLARYGGAVAVDTSGNCGRSFTTQMMPWATISSRTKCLNYGILPGDDFKENLQ